ncbi:nitroreductase family protein (plasmid) [Rhizobium leguminosarum]
MPSAKAAPSASSFQTRARTAWRLFANFAYDYRRFRRASFIDGAESRENRRAHIHLLAHMLEYGMSLSNPRNGFGMDKVRLLAVETRRYIEQHGRDASADISLSVLSAYVDFNAEQGDVSEAQALLDDLLVVAGAGHNIRLGGSETVSAAEIVRHARMDFVSFMEARHSVRQYDSNRTVAFEKIERSIRAAQQSPSSCNRQTCRVYAFTEKPSIARVLAHHDGNRGFGEQLGGVFVVTVDLSHWNTIGERNQGWVDGGMFAMTLALGLHAEGLGACMLNWSAAREQDINMRTCVGIPDNEIIITLIGFGEMRADFRVPVSARKPIDMVLTHEPPLR